MNPEIRFTCTALNGTNKQGILPKDENGYYIQPIGALNVFNSVGDYYTYNGARELFESSSTLMRRVQAGCLCGELGHPKPLPGQSMDAYANRVMTIEETNVSHHFSEIWLDMEGVKDQTGRPVIAIMAKIKPDGPHAAAMESGFNNPKKNTCFSIRAFTEDNYVGGVKNRVLKQIVTWDCVQEPGLDVARKYRSPTLESYHDATFHRSDLVSILNPKTCGIATESTRAFGVELFRHLGWKLHDGERSLFTKW